MTDLHWSSFGNSILPESYFVFYATRCQVYCRFDADNMTFANTLISISHTQTNTQHHVEGPIDWHINIYYRHLLCAHSSYLYYVELITHWYQNFILQRSPILCFSKIAYLLIRFNKTKYFLWNTKNTDKIL